MPRNWSFWRNVTIIGIIHAAVLLGLSRWSSSAKKPVATEIVWMDGSAGLVSPGAALPVVAETVPTAPPPPAPDEQAMQMPSDAPSRVTPAQSEIELPSPTPSSAPAPRSTASLKPASKAGPAAKTTPSASLKTSAKASPKATPKTLVAKGATPAPKPTATALQKKAAQNEAKKVEVTPALPGNSSVPGTDPVSGSAGANARGRGTGSAAQFNWYARMLHDRFFSEWIQPTSVVASGAKMSVLVRLRIEKDGRVSDFAVVRPSGNVVVDESVAAVAQRVVRVDPPPAGVSSSGRYDVNINFELNPEQ